VCVSKCGNGIREESIGESCDDFNMISEDGCSSTCQVEDGFTCLYGSLLRNDECFFRPIVTLESNTETNEVTVMFDQEMEDINLEEKNMDFSVESMDGSTIYDFNVEYKWIGRQKIWFKFSDL
jgi:cysteine-rich repeat protein